MQSTSVIQHLLYMHKFFNSMWNHKDNKGDKIDDLSGDYYFCMEMSENDRLFFRYELIKL